MGEHYRLPMGCAYVILGFATLFLTYITANIYAYGPREILLGVGAFFLLPCAILAIAIPIVGWADIWSSYKHHFILAVACAFIILAGVVLGSLLPA